MRAPTTAIVLALLAATGCGERPDGSAQGPETPGETTGEACSTSTAGGEPESTSTGEYGETDAESGTETGDAADPVAEAPWSSGSRLRARVLEGGGARWIDGWRDEDAGIGCRVHPTEAGLRCLPDTYAQRFFADAACSEPVWIAGDCDAVPDMVLASTPPLACEDSTYGAFEIGASLGTGEYYFSSGGDCQVAGSEAQRHAMTPLDPTQFAEFEEVVVERHERLGTRAYRGPDGSHRWASAYDLDRDEGCSIFHQTPVRACAPLNTAYAYPDFFGRDDCSDPGVVLHAPQCTSPQFASLDGVLHAVGAPLDGVWTEAAGSCEALEIDRTALTLGDPVADGVLPPAADVYVGDGRLAFRMVTGPDGTPVAPAYQWADSELGDCAVRETSLGWRCVPSSFASRHGEFWGDPDCVDQPLELVQGVGPGTWLNTSSDEVCVTYGPDVVQLGDPYAGIVYRDDAQGCTEYDEAGGEPYFRLGQVVPVSSLPPIEVIVE